MADTIRFGEFAPRPAAWPSGKAEDCKSFTPSSNLGAASFNNRLTNGVCGGSTQWVRSGGQRASGLAPLAFPHLLSGSEQ